MNHFYGGGSCCGDVCNSNRCEKNFNRFEWNKTIHSLKLLLPLTTIECNESNYWTQLNGMSFKSHLVTQGDWKEKMPLNCINHKSALRAHNHITVHQSFANQMQQQYHLKASCSNGVIEASDQSNRNAVTFGLLLANRRDLTRIQLRITWNGCARLFAFYTFSISQPANRLAGRRRGYKIVSLHFIPIDFNCNGKFVVHSVAFEMLMQKKCVGKIECH